ncbi:hypothetical protein G4O51_10545 [Candidatus Bathyarchaeota archaeon A05DMB-2]|nr:hypothetical protein [Candidatus Bathyarchaeota archaeon A05DMB-2]
MATEPAAFDGLLLRAIDEALNSLGKSVGQAIYFHIENTFGINRTQIPENLQAFQEALEKIFGAGARLIEVQIIKNLHVMTGNSLVMKRSEFEFIKYVDAAKQSYLRNAPQRTVESQPCTLSFLSVFTVSVSKH